MPSPTPRPPARRGLSLGTKLIAAIVFLLAAAVGAGTLYSQGALEELARKSVEERRREGEAAMERQAKLTVRNLATSAAPPLVENNFTYLEELVKAAQAEDANVVWLSIRDTLSGGEQVAAAGAVPTAGDGLARIDEALGQGGGGVVSVPGDGMSVYAANIEYQGKVIGSIRLGYSTAELEKALDAALASARDDAASSAKKQLLVAGMILLAGILLGAIQAIRMTRQLESLTIQAGRIAAGELRQRVSVASRDEIGQLAVSFNAMAESLGVLLREVAGKASLERELEIARGVQDLMSPPRELHHAGPYSIAGLSEMATQCGGDWWSFRELSGGRTLIVVGDVTGHGMPAAMVAATARGALEAMRTIDEAHVTPTKVLEAMDHAIRGIGQVNLLMTCFAVMLDPAAGTIEFANAGHCFPYTSSRNPDGTLADLSVLAIRGNPLGMATRSFSTWKRPFKVGDVLVLSTDGLIDRINHTGERFGDRRFRALLAASTLRAEPAGAQELRDRIVDAVDRFGGGTPPDDDVTIIVVHFHGQRAFAPGLQHVA